MPHAEVTLSPFSEESFYKAILPQQLTLITYPYEWCFHQWKHATLLTLQVMKLTLAHGMILKDATPFNIQFVNCKPVWIDTLSFEMYNEAEPWVAYRQFCEMFLAPLALMAYSHTSFQKILLAYPEGIPIEVASKLLPFKSKFKMGLLLHIHLHAKLKNQNNQKNKPASFTKNKLLAIIDSLESTVSKLSVPNTKSKWSNYYADTVLSKEYIAEKEIVVKGFLAKLNAEVILDVGANDGHFSKIAASFAKRIIAIDADERSIDRLFIEQQNAERNMDVLVTDVAHPSPALGALLKERSSLMQRIKADAVLALAVLHHLVITDHFTMDMAADLFAELGEHLIIEFPLPEDEKVKLISGHVKDISLIYTLEKFKKGFERFFVFEDKVQLTSAQRIIYYLKRK